MRRMRRRESPKSVQTSVDSEIYDMLSEEAEAFSSMAAYLRFIIYEHFINKGRSLPRRAELQYKMMLKEVKEFSLEKEQYA